MNKSMTFAQDGISLKHKETSNTKVSMEGFNLKVSSQTQQPKPPTPPVSPKSKQ